MHLGWVTVAKARGKDEDESIALAALADLGVEVAVVDWDDPDVRWADFDRIILRSPWDYTERLAEFLAWTDATAAVTEVVNSPAIVRWNIDKTYLRDLEAAGVPVIETTFLAAADDPVLPDGEFVVKPSVGAGSRDAASYGPQDHAAALAHVAHLQSTGVTVMVQPLVASVPIDGEWPLLFFAGEYSHAANKHIALPRAGFIEEFFAPETNAPYEATAEQIDVARRALDVAIERFGVPTYARVDLVRGDDGGPQVLELELVEPSLFLPYGGTDAVRRFVAALTATREGTSA